MDETGKRLLSLMFNPGETICVSPNKYGYHSIPLERAFSGKVTLVAPVDEDGNERPIEYDDSDNLLLVALNPIKGFREDSNCTALRSFLIEMDTGPVEHQLAYIKTLGLPYSAVIFSGNKSLHFLITLDTDLPNEGIYRMFSEWILKVCTLADQQTKNPSRSIRIPGAVREIGKIQKLVEFHGKVKIGDLAAWLNLRPDAKPKKHEKKLPTENVSAYNVKKWAIDRLINGLDPTKSRNGQWFSLAYEFALSGYSEDATMALFEQYFVPDRDFKEREWKTAINSAYKRVYSGK